MMKSSYEQFIDDYKPFLDRFGFVQPEPNGSTSQNSIRFTGEAILAVHTHFRENMPLPIQAWLDARIKAIHSCQLVPGLLKRDPESTEQNSADNYHSACAVGYLYSPKLAQDIYRYGRSQNFIFDNNNKREPRDFLGWQPALQSFMKFCAGEKLSFYDQILISTGIFLSAKDRSQDGKVLTWFIVRCCKDQGLWLVNNAITYWKKKLHEHYPNGIGGVLAAYFHPQHENQPSAKWLAGIYE